MWAQVRTTGPILPMFDNPTKDSSSLSVIAISNESIVQNQFEMELFPQPAAAADVQIRYKLPKVATVTIEILDLQRRSLLKNFAGEQAVGQQQWIIPAHTFNAGSYFVKLQVDNLIEIKRMVVMH